MPNTLDAPAKEIERTYEMTLTPADGPLDGRLPYEPRRVRLRYDPAVADDLHPQSPEAEAEAVKRALRLEQKEFESDDVAAAVFTTHVRYISGSLVDYLPRSRPRPRPRSNR